jgi:Rod binding domain-containing protein
LTPQSRPKALRSDFAQALEARLAGFAPEGASLTIQGLPEAAKAELTRLQGAAEDLEAVFLKGLLGQMRRVRFADTDGGPMADLARDLMDQAMAESTARRAPGTGLAQTIFLQTAQAVVRRFAAEAQTDNQEKRP